MHRIIIGAFCLLTLATPALAQFTIENPTNGSKQSGISLISGWKCTGNNLRAIIDGVFTLTLPYGSQRNDTRGPCGDANNGFGLLVNWNLLANGSHTIRFYDGGFEFADATFTVQTLGSEFLTGKSKTVEVPNFPNSGQTTRLEWQESSQNFVIAGLQSGGDPEGYNVTGAETRSVCFNPDNNGSVSYRGSLTVEGEFSATGIFSYAITGGTVEERASFNGQKSMSNDAVNGNFTIAYYVNDTLLGDATGLFQGTATDERVQLSYNGSSLSLGCLIAGSLNAVR